MKLFPKQDYSKPPMSPKQAIWCSAVSIPIGVVIIAGAYFLYLLPLWLSFLIGLGFIYFVTCLSWMQLRWDTKNFFFNAWGFVEVVLVVVLIVLLFTQKEGEPFPMWGILFIISAAVIVGLHAGYIAFTNFQMWRRGDLTLRLVGYGGTAATSSDNEIYVLEGLEDKVVEWAVTIVGSLEKEMEDVESNTTIYKSENNGNVILSRRMGNRDIMGIRFTNKHWDNDIACARDAFKYLGKETLCDLGDNEVNPYRWWRIDSIGEGITSLDFEQDEIE
jgi:hypothetical protein